MRKSEFTYLFIEAHLTNENQTFGLNFSITKERKKKIKNIHIYISIEHSKFLTKIYLFNIIIWLVFLINDMKQAISYEFLVFKFYSLPNKKNFILFQIKKKFIGLMVGG